MIYRRYINRIYYPTRPSEAGEYIQICNGGKGKGIAGRGEGLRLDEKVKQKLTCKFIVWNGKIQ